MKFKKIVPIQTLLAFSVISTGISAETIDIEARKASIAPLERRIKDREAQIAEHSNDLLRIHARVGGKLDRAVQRLTSIKDSAKSGFRVSAAKLELMKGLQSSVERFQRERRKAFQDIKDMDSARQKKIHQGELDHFDKHIEKHIDQILLLSKSFTQDENVKKYEQDSGGGYYDGYWYQESVRISDEYRQNRRDRIMDKKQKTAVTAALTKSKERCHSLITTLQQNLNQKSTTAEDRKLIEDELARHQRMLYTRQQQLDELLLVNKPSTSEISRDTARDFTKSLEDLMVDIQKDLRSIFNLHNQLRKENTKIIRLKQNLEDRKEWLKNNANKAQQP